MSTETSQTQRFVVEAREHLAGMTSSLIALERGEGDARVHFEQLLRAAHSIKGGSGFTGRGRIEQLAHALEAALESIREGRAAPSPDVIDMLLSTLDRLGAMVDNLEHSDETDISDLLERLSPLTDSSTSAARTQTLAATEPPAREGVAAAVVRTAARPEEFPLSQRVLAAWQGHTAFLYGVKLDWFQCERACGLAPLEVARRLAQGGTVLDSRLDFAGPPLCDALPTATLAYRAIVGSSLKPEQFARQLGIPCATIVRLEAVDNGPRPAAAPAGEPAKKPPAAATSLRIPVSLIDRMMGLAGELVLVRNQVMHSSDPGVVNLRHLLRRLDSVTSELQDAALRMRMQPVGALFERFPRLVRDLARQLGKQIEIRITGTEVELDKTILEVLSDPLTHMVRNCCDHGIEPPADRARAGKPPTGVIGLSARQQGGRILIEIRDDGHGLDREAIRRKALEKGVRSQAELDALSEQQVYSLILLSGFSTASRVTDVSGRGVGMDVVKTNLERIGGVLEIDSAPGEGTVFTLSLPLTLAIVPCLLIRSTGQAFAIPQRDVEELVLLEPGADRARLEISHGEEVLRLRGRLLPVARLAEVLTRRVPFTAQTWSAILAAQHQTAGAPRREYVAVVKFASRRFGLVVDDLLGSEDIVVMPLHPLLRSLAVYGGATILGDGTVAMILSGEGIARHCGIAHRPQVQQPPALAVGEVETHTLLLFRSGPAERLAMPLGLVRRVVRISRGQIQRVGDREMVNVDGTAVQVLRVDQYLPLSPCPDLDVLHLILPRHDGAPVGLLAAEIDDTPTLPVQIDTGACRADGIVGSVLIRGEITPLLDVDRLLQIREQAGPRSRPALPAPAGRRILVVDDTQFFRQMIKGLLEGAGYVVTVAVDGVDALARLAEETFDLVVSDVEMPRMDGLTLARQIRGASRLAHLPLLAVTTLSGAEDRARALAGGFDAYEVKLDRGSFLEAVGSLLEAGRPAGPSGGGARHE